ncbi:4-hydroxy-tetrahydrodipicolinate synthase [Candidatus Azambacteria bacterium]|nr:4-hydroxy-tetrahydrodipicolinate synthase [Candidatus Azambacteria bacterium]
MNLLKFRGTWTALITPFLDNQEIDYQALSVLIERQIAGGVTGIVVIGTTGESPTLSDQECSALIKRAKELIAGRCWLMAGCGTNHTAHSVEKAQAAQKAGADALLVVNPYYNKPSQQGLYLHFKEVAQATNLPNILYNIKGRTGVNLETDTLMRLAKEVDNIIGVKEASGDLVQIKEVSQRKLEDFLLFSGDDGLTYQVLEQAKGDGVISVASNIIPREVNELVQAGLRGDFKTAKQLDDQLQKLFKILFIETNPLPVKYMAHKLGLCHLVYRLPMCPPSEKNQMILNEAFNDYFNLLS